MFLKSSQLTYMWEYGETAPLNPECSQNSEGQSWKIGLAKKITPGILYQYTSYLPTVSIKVRKKK